MSRLEKRKNKKMNKSLIIVPISLVVLCVGGFAYHQKIFYENHYRKETYVYAVDISKLSVDNAYDKLNTDLKSENIELIPEAGDTIKIPLTDIVDINKDDLEKVLKNQDSKSIESKNLLESIQASIEKLDLNKESKSNENAKVIKEDGKFKVEKEKQGTIIDIEKLTKEVQNKLTGSEQLSINLKDFYTKPDIVSDNDDLQKQINDLEKQMTASVSFSVKGETVKLSNDRIKDSVKPDGIDTAKIKEEIQKMDDKYRTKNNTINFKTSNGETRSLYSAIDYGWYIDVDATANLIAEAIKNSEENKNIEAVIKGSGYNDNTQFGGNYAEVDLNEQKAYIYKDGKKVFSWDVITGKANSRNMTNVGIHEVLYKETPSVLRGTNNDGSAYASPVNYWVPFNWEGEGFHDANWQVYGFGGDKYKTLGSHGCVNTSPTDMKKVFELTYTGMPVIVWGDIYNGL